MDANGGTRLGSSKHEGLNVWTNSVHVQENAVLGGQKIKEMAGIWMPMDVHVWVLLSMKALMYGQILYMFNIIWDII